MLKREKLSDYDFEMIKKILRKFWVSAMVE
jgi:hypothetical protein